MSLPLIEDSKKQCFNLIVSEKDQTDLTFADLHSYLKEKFEGFNFLSVNHLQMKAVGLEFKLKNANDTYKTHRSNTHVVDYDSDSSNGEERRCMPPNLFGHLRLNQAHVLH